MLRKVEESFFQEDLKEIAIQSINFKESEGFSFGKLTLLHHDMFDGKANDIFKAATAVELLVLSFDILDDLQDKDNLNTPWSKCIPALTLNLAIGLLSLSTKIISELQIAPDSNKIFHYLSLRAINGQHLDLINLANTEEQYITIAAQKAGSLIALASLIGASLATNKYHDIIEDYSVHVGIAEQIKNDINDLFSSSKNDWQNKKKSLPILYILENKIDSKVLDYYEGKLTYKEIYENSDEVKNSLTTSGSIMYANVILRKHQLLAEERINSLSIKDQYKTKILNSLNIKRRDD